MWKNKKKRIIHFGFLIAFVMLGGRIRTIFAASTQSILYETSGMNRYSKVDGQTIMYDGRGNMTDDGTATYSYNMLNQQVSATVAGQTTQYLYDALGRRIGKLQNGVTTRYIHDLRQQVLEEHRNGSLHARLTYGATIDDPLTIEQGGQTYHYHQDALGNVTELSNSSGAVVERYKYNIYGKVSITDGSGNPLASSAVGNEVLFNGRRYNPETNTYHYRARVYNPEWGQFLQRDTLDPGLLGSGPQGHNRYSYVMANPVNYTDPTGHIACAGACIAGALAVAAVGAILSDMIAPEPVRAPKDACEAGERIPIKWGNEIAGLAPDIFLDGNPLPDKTVGRIGGRLIDGKLDDIGRKVDDIADNLCRGKGCNIIINQNGKYNTTIDKAVNSNIMADTVYINAGSNVKVNQVGKYNVNIGKGNNLDIKVDSVVLGSAENTTIQAERIVDLGQGTTNINTINSVGKYNVNIGNANRVSIGDR